LTETLEEAVFELEQFNEKIRRQLEVLDDTQTQLQVNGFRN